MSEENANPSSRTTPQVPSTVLENLPAACAARRPAVRLHPRRATALDHRTSKLGGAFAWPANDPWPRCELHGIDFISVAQIRAIDVPTVTLPKGADVFQLLWCPVYDKNHGPTPIAAATRWRSGAVGSEARPSRGVLPDDDLFVEECALHPEAILDFPFESPDEVEAFLAAHSVTPDATDFVEGWSIDDLRDRLRPASGTKVGGCTDRIQEGGYTCCHRNVDAFFTVAAWEFYGETSVWVPLEDRGAEDSDLIRAPIGASLNKEGHFYVFVCPSCGLEWHHFEN